LRQQGNASWANVSDAPRPVYDRSTAQLVTGSFMDYAMPRADMLPNFEIALEEVRCKTNPIGVKGIGESGTIGAPPVVINAIIDALGPLGIDRIDMPATPSRVWQAIQSAKGGRPCQERGAVSIAQFAEKNSCRSHHALDGNCRETIESGRLASVEYR